MSSFFEVFSAVPTNRAGGAAAALARLAAACFGGVAGLAGLSVLVGCGGDFEEDRRPVPNRPPVVAKDSLAWSPLGLKVRLDAPHTYSVKASDPDIGDFVVGYEWIFVNFETSWFDAHETSVPSLEYVLEAASVVAADNVSTATVMVRASDNKGAVGQYETFAIPVLLPGEPEEPEEPEEPI